MLRKAGTELTSSGDKIPKELSFHFKNDKTEVSLKYDTLVLSDTGDLQEEFDLISNRITANINNLF